MRCASARRRRPLGRGQPVDELLRHAGFQPRASIQLAADRLLGPQWPVEVRGVRVPIGLLGRLQSPQPFEPEPHVADLVAMNGAEIAAL